MTPDRRATAQSLAYSRISGVVLLSLYILRLQSAFELTLLGTHTFMYT